MASLPTRPGMSRRMWLTDGPLALGLTAFTVGVTALWVDQFSTVDREVDFWAVTLVALAGLSLVARRRVPVVVLGLVTALTTAYLIAGYPYGPVFLAFIVAVYTVARHRPLATSAIACGVALVVILTHLFTNDAALDGWLGLIPATAWVVVPYAIGTTVRLTREAADRARSEALRERLDDERLRIAEEVHDVVGHGLAAIQMQADIALHVAERDPGQSTAALERISRTSSEAFEELRSTLHLIRRADDVPRRPTPGLDRIEELCRRIREAGVEVELTVTGRRLELPGPVDFAAYRVLQEALTNVIRHSPIRKAKAEVDYTDDAVLLTITNPGAVLPPTNGGLGIAGMRRRVAMVNGTFHAGATGDGFQVTAQFPIGSLR